MSKAKRLITEYYPWIVLGSAFLLLLFLNVFYLNNWIDSDMAAEMMFSRLLSEEGGIFASTNWYYSTEFRFLYTHLVMGPLFRICGSWHVIRAVTNVVFYLLMLLSYFYMMAEVPVSRRGKVLGGAVLLLPFSETLMLHMHMGNTYISHVVILFFYIGLFLRLVRLQDESVKKNGTAGTNLRRGFLWALFLALSVICGVSGVRYMLSLQAPLMIASTWFLAESGAFRKLREKAGKEQLKKVLGSVERRFLTVSLSGVLGCVAGYAINVVYVSRTYIFQTYESTDFIDVYQGNFLDRLQDAFGCLLMLFGYIPGKSVLSVRGIVTMAAFFLLFFSGYCAVRAGKTKEFTGRFMALLFYSSFFLNSFVFIFTNSTLVPRYYIMTAVLLIPLACLYFKEENRPLDRYLMIFLLVGCLFLATAKVSFSVVTADKNRERKAAEEELTKQGYTFGYATYWNANIMQELSNGRIETANVRMSEEGDILFFKWSSMMRYYEPDYHEGAVFLLLTDEEAESWKGTDVVRAGKEICRVSGYVIYHYDSNEVFLRAIEEDGSFSETE